MRIRTWAGLMGTMALCVTLTACKDSKTVQENEQLKSQVAELQKENGQLGNNLETVTADRDNLAKENAELKAEIKPAAKKKRAAKKTAKRRRA